jgi:hypothetical protein
MSMALNPIDKAIADIKFAIPKQILNKVFLASFGGVWTPLNSSIDQQIRTLVLDAKVLPDCDVVGGVKMYLPTSDIPREYTDQFTVIFRVPKDRIQGRTITNVLGIGYLETNSFAQYNITNQMNECSVNTLTENALALMSANQSIPISSTAECTLIAENTVMVKDTMYIKPNGYLWCELANAEDMANIQIRSLLQFSKLCVLATKAYIYTQYLVTMDQGENAAGKELGAFRSVIESYSDAADQYLEYLQEVWTVVAFCNDARQYTDFIRMQVGGRR